MTQQEEYVRARWERVFDRETIVAGHGWMVRLPIIWHKSLTDGYFKTKAAAWQAAYDFTVAREEEIRQLDEEICQMDDLSQMKRQDIDCEIDTAEGYDPSWNDNALVVYVRDLCEYSRTLARLQQALEDLEKGMVKA